VSRYLLDTCAIAAVLLDTVSPAVAQALDTADAVCASAASFYEIGQKVRVGKWPAMQPHLADLETLLARSAVTLLPLEPRAALLAATMEWPNRDPFDRMIVATAQIDDLTVITSDQDFAARVPTLW
jgi:PIN domain nuclease of toxin-antitoxin system